MRWIPDGTSGTIIEAIPPPRKRILLKSLHAALPEVMEFYRTSGDVDYLLKVLVSDIAEYDRFYKKLIAIAPLSDVSSNFAMEQVKYSTEVPV